MYVQGIVGVFVVGYTKVCVDSIWLPVVGGCVVFFGSWLWLLMM